MQCAKPLLQHPVLGLMTERDIVIAGVRRYDRPVSLHLLGMCDLQQSRAHDHSRPGATARRFGRISPQHRVPICVRATLFRPITLCGSERPYAVFQVNTTRSRLYSLRQRKPHQRTPSPTNLSHNNRPCHKHGHFHPHGRHDYASIFALLHSARKRKDPRVARCGSSLVRRRSERATAYRSRVSPVSNRYASRYFESVFVTISSGKVGAGGVLFHRPLSTSS